MKSKCLDLLVMEHKTMLRAINVLVEMARRAVVERQLDEEDASALLEIFRVVGDDWHQGKEEGALFPVFTAGCERAELDSVRHMLFEHEQDRSLMIGIEDALRRSDATGFSDLATHLAEILRTHIYKEDNILFEIIDKSFSPDDDVRVVSQFEAFDREFKERGQDKLLHRLRMLEWKYLSKAA